MIKFPCDRRIAPITFLGGRVFQEYTLDGFWVKFASEMRMNTKAIHPKTFSEISMRSRVCGYTSRRLLHGVWKCNTRVGTLLIRNVAVSMAFPQYYFGT